MKDMMIGVDLAKNVFQLHAASMAGHLKFRKKLTRAQFPKFMAEQLPSVVVMEACASASYWARELSEVSSTKTGIGSWLYQCVGERLSA